MSVKQVVNDLTYEEIKGWSDYFKRRPVDTSDDMRTYKLMSTFAAVMGGKIGKPEDLFESLAKIKEQEAERTIGQKLAGSKMLQMILTSKGGDTIPL